jgi:hypothetical protein
MRKYFTFKSMLNIHNFQYGPFSYIHISIKHPNKSKFYLPTDAQLKCLKRNSKTYIKLTLKQLQYVSV